MMKGPRMGAFLSSYLTARREKYMKIKANRKIWLETGFLPSGDK